MASEAEPLRILILDDDLVYRHILVKMLDRVPGARVVAAVGTIAAAQARVEAGDVDLITVDVVLAEGSGLTILPWLSKKHPKVVAVLLTAGTEKRASQDIDAILLGASRLMLKPSGPDAPQVLARKLTEIVENCRVRPGAAVRAQAPLEPVFAAPRAVVAVGASTGGPPVLLQFLRGLPASHEQPIVVTQHIAAEHMGSFADMLRYPGGRDVRLAAHGELLVPKTVYLAGNGRHLKLIRDAGRLRVVQDDSPEENYSRPAVDPMFRSVADACGQAAVGVVMTGMGADGAKGALALRARGAPVAAQDQASSVVWGMPGAVVAAGAANAIVPSAQLATTVGRWLGGYLAQIPEVRR